MIETSFFGYSKKEVYIYLEKLIQNYEDKFNMLEEQRLKLIKQNEQLKLKIEEYKNKKSMKYQIKDIESYSNFINNYFLVEWNDINKIKSDKITIEYDKSLENLNKILDDLKNQIYNINLIKERFFNELRNLLLLLNDENIQQMSFLNKGLKNDFIIDNEVIIPKNVVITKSLLESIKQKGLMIEFLKHLAKEDI